MHKLRIPYCRILAVIALWLCPPALADKDLEGSSAIYIGPAVLEHCKYVKLLYRRKDKDVEDTSLDIKSNKFGKIVKWIFVEAIDSRYPKLNQGTIPEYFILLSTMEHHNLNDILLIIPVSQETLGPNYREKLAELRSMIISARSSIQ